MIGSTITCVVPKSSLRQPRSLSEQVCLNLKEKTKAETRTKIEHCNLTLFKGILTHSLTLSDYRNITCPLYKTLLVIQKGCRERLLSNPDRLNNKRIH